MAVETALAPSERRDRSDRRRQPTPIFSRYAISGGRREGGRRVLEDVNTFVDRYGAKLFVMVIAVVLLNLADAYFTLLFLSYGGTELNPVVDQVLRHSVMLFVLLKTLGIGICVAFLTVASKFRVARVGLWTVLTGYTVLLGWHLWLLTHLPS